MYKLIGQFRRDFGGCKTQVVKVSREVLDPLVELGRSALFVCNVNVGNESFV